MSDNINSDKNGKLHSENNNDKLTNKYKFWKENKKKITILSLIWALFNFAIKFFILIVFIFGFLPYVVTFVAPWLSSINKVDNADFIKNNEEKLNDFSNQEWLNSLPNKNIRDKVKSIIHLQFLYNPIKKIKL